MESIFEFIHTHQAAVIAVVILALIVVYFLIKNLVKLAMVAILILVLVGTYFFLTAPKKSPSDLIRAWQKMKGETVTVVEKGKAAVKTGQEVLKKGQEISQGVVDKLKKGEAEKGAKKD
ncbi:MAG TPA: hypothetical protein PLT64_02440 [Syntrophales bacterium]|nr:hypothetical protein [Syntrophales bacterium]HOL58710.1 hypothetical protein [Syntrophales bacterium]HPO35002.1 hypothetical protein [Syntrophales bacterium]